MKWSTRTCKSCFGTNTSLLDQIGLTRVKAGATVYLNVYADQEMSFVTFSATGMTCEWQLLRGPVVCDAVTDTIGFSGK